MRFIPAVSPVQIQSPLPHRRDAKASLRYTLEKGIRPVGQVVKTRPFHGCNMGSSPVRVTTSAARQGRRQYGGLAQLVRAPASHAGGHWFESSSLHQKVPDFVRNQELFLFMISKVTRYFSVFPSTQTVTQDTKGPESTGQERRGYTRRSCPLFCLLHCLTDDIADGICGIPFHLLRGVGVGAEGKACVVVPQGTR